MEKKIKKGHEAHLTMVNLKKKTNLVFYSICSIGLMFVAIFILLNNFLYRRILLIWSLILGRLETICGCSGHFVFINHPLLFTTLALIGLGILSFLIFALIKLTRIIIATRRFIKVNLKNRQPNLSPKLEKASKFLKLEDKVVEIKSQSIVVFCYGFLKQRIYLSTDFISKLRYQELVAVLLHEQYHLNKRETIKIFIVKAVTAILFFIPGLKFLAQQYSIYSELAADEWALNNLENRQFLASAVYKALKHKEVSAKQQNIAVSYFGREIMDERIKQIAGQSIFNKDFFNLKFILNFLLITVFIVAFGFFTYSSKPVKASHNNGCLMDNHIAEPCQMLMSEPCQMDYIMQPVNVVCPFDNM